MIIFKYKSWHTIIVNTNNVLIKYYEKVTFGIIISFRYSNYSQLEVTMEQMIPS